MLHFLAFLVGVVVYATEVQNAMDDDTVQFLVVGGPEQFGVGEYGVQRNICVANEYVSLAVVKADMVGVVVVSDELAVDAQDFLVVPYHASLTLGVP